MGWTVMEAAVKVAGKSSSGTVLAVARVPANHMVAGFVVEKDDRIRAGGPDVEVHNGSSGGQAQLELDAGEGVTLSSAVVKDEGAAWCLRERRQYRNGKA
jgi:hypothetical protein